jgi:hypothetical protein
MTSRRGEPKQSGGLAASNTNMSINPAMLPSKPLTLKSLSPSNLMRSIKEKSGVPGTSPSLQNFTPNSYTQNTNLGINKGTLNTVNTVQSPVPKLSTIQGFNQENMLGVKGSTFNQNIAPEQTFQSFEQKPQIDPMDEIRRRILESYEQTPEERAKLQELAQLNESFRLGQNQIQDQRIPLTDIQGQQASLERLYQGRAATLKDEIMLRQAERQARQERALKELELLRPQETRNEGFTLGKDQVRFEYDPKTGTYKQVGIGIGSQNNTQNAIEEKRQSQALQQANTALASFDQIFQNPALKRGALNRVIGGLIAGSKSNDLQNSIKTIESLIGFDALQKMREASPTGGALGSISDREIGYLQSVAGSLATKQSDKQLEQNLKRIRKSFEILKMVNSPDGSRGFIDGVEVTKQGDAIITTVNGVPYILQGDSFVRASFNNVGNTSASRGNLPQRNNNPGNIKAGGLADKYAIGRDKQGHLIFPDVQTGFRAMREDIQAKINGRSRFLPKNPTLAQLGSVYAEDRMWANRIASILGVSPSTPTKNIPFEQLIQAIARQEGFYA